MTQVARKTWLRENVALRAREAIRASGLTHREIGRRMATESGVDSEDERRKIVRWDPEDDKPLETWITDREARKLAVALGIPPESLLPNEAELRAVEAARLVRRIEAMGGVRAVQAAARLAREI